MAFVYSFGLGFVFIMGVVFWMMVFSILRWRDKKTTEFQEKLNEHWKCNYLLLQIHAAHLDRIADELEGQQQHKKDTP